MYASLGKVIPKIGLFFLFIPADRGVTHFGDHFTCTLISKGIAAYGNLLTSYIIYMNRASDSVLTGLEHRHKPGHT